MKFLRRTDLSPQTRAKIALDAYLHQGVWGHISELAKRYQISRQFIYLLIWSITNVFEPKTPEPRVRTQETIELRWDRLLIALKLQGHCSVGDISEIFKLLEIERNSVGFISERLKEFASEIPKKHVKLNRCIVVLIDETFSGQRPILVVLEARSHYILEAIWAPDRKAHRWQGLLESLKSQGYEFDYVVADQAGGIRKGCENASVAHLPDLMHLIHPFGPWVSRYERNGYKAIQKEYERESVFGNAKSEANLQKRLEEYEEAVRQAEKSMRRYDDYVYLWEEFIKAFDPFNYDGTMRTRSVVEGEVDTILALMENEFDDPKLHIVIKRFREAVLAYWVYFERLETIIEQLSKNIPQDVLRELCLAWQAEKKSRGAKNYKHKKALERKTEEHRFLAACGNMEDFDSLVQTVFDFLESNVRSSSPIESINSLIRDYLNNSRGQITQEMLNMIAYYINHKVASRGPYKGTSAWERLSGIRENTTFIDQILQYSKKAA